MTIKNLLTIITLLLLTGCTPETTVKPVPVISHTQVNKTLDGCENLGQVKVKFEAIKRLSQRENRLKAQALLKQQAFDEYRANNIVIINTQYLKGEYREKSIVSGRGVAYLCYSSKND